MLGVGVKEQEKDPMQQGSAGIMGVGGPQAPTGNALKPKKRTTQGSGFTGLQSYLTNNPNASAQASQQLGTESTGLGQKVAEGTKTVTGQIQGQQATGMGQQYKDVNMSPVQDLGKEEQALKNRANLLGTGQYTEYARASGLEPMTEGEGAIFGGMLGATMHDNRSQIEKVAGQDAVGEALRGLATTQDTQRAAYNKAVQDYTDQYLASQAAAQEAARNQFAGAPAPRRNSDFWNNLSKTAPISPSTPGSDYLAGNSLHAQLNALVTGDIPGAVEKSLAGTATTIADVGGKLSGGAKSVKKKAKKIFG